MEERPFGRRSGLTAPRVNIGTMRLPGDALDAVALIRHALDAGMRYIDTSRGYGESEFLVGRALEGVHRGEAIVSTKCSPWIKKVTDADDGSAESARRRIDESRLRLGLDRLDFYQVWNVDSPEAWETATRPGGMVDGIRRAIDDGVVAHTGFTSHEKPEKLLGYLDEADWCEALLVSYNMISRDYEPVIQAAHDKGIATIVMNPIGGGKFAEDSPVLMELAARVGAVSVADLAARFALSNPAVDSILCGLSKPSDADDTIASVERGPFGEQEMLAVRAFVDERTPAKTGFCTGCNYCMPCPQGIEIPQIMGAVYEDRVLGLTRGARNAYGWATRSVKVSACVRCGQCEEKCTQHLSIMEDLEYAGRTYEEKPGGE